MNDTQAQAVALAPRGGGAHGAVTWGVPDRLTERRQRIDSLRGVSSGALTGVMLVQGLMAFLAELSEAGRAAAPNTG